MLNLRNKINSFSVKHDFFYKLILLFTAKIKKHKRTYNVSYSWQDPVADDPNPMLCTLNHIKGPSVWEVCGLPLGEGRGMQEAN